MNKNVESIRRKAEIGAVRSVLQKIGMQLSCDFTPMGKINQDLAILDWFSCEGRNLDFDFLVYFEYDMLATRTIENLYDRYTHYDAGFVDYRRAHPSWLWYGNPPGVKESVFQWLKDHSSRPIVYRGFFPGHIISREVLKKLEGMKLPHGFCEMRLPTVITGFGFSCARLGFPMVRYRPPLSNQMLREIQVWVSSIQFTTF